MTNRGGKTTRFPNTSWSLVGRAAASDELTRQKAMSELLIAYTPALKSFLVECKRLSEELAEDLLHDFVVDKLLTRKLIHHADKGKGRFRNYVLRSLTNFVSTKMKQKSRARSRLTDFDENRIADPLSKLNSNQFDKEWVQLLVREALKRMKTDCREGGREDLWEILQLRVVEPMLFNKKPLDYKQIVRRFKIKTPRQAINLLATAKRCFIRHLRLAVSLYVNDEDKIDKEIADLREIVGR